MATMFGVSKLQIEKLRKFQISLMERKVKITDVIMDFISKVQFSSDINVIPSMQTILVSNNSIYFMDGMVIIPRSKISKITINGNEVIIQFRVPNIFTGAKIYLVFRNARARDEFLQAFGDLEDNDDDHSDASLTPPDSNDSDSN